MSYEQYVSNRGGGGGIQEYPNFGALPNPTTNGTIALTLDTFTLYVFDAGTNTWIAIGTPGMALTIGPIDSNPPSSDGASLSLGALIMQSASVLYPGLVNNVAQSFSGLKTFQDGINLINTTANHLVYADGSNIISDLPNWSLDPVTFGVAANLSITPGVGPSGQTINAFAIDVNASTPSATFSVNNVLAQQSYDQAGGGQDNAGAMNNLLISTTMDGNGHLAQQESILIQQQAGNGSNTGTLDNARIVDILFNTGAGFTVGNYSGLYVNADLSQGTITGNANSIQTHMNGAILGDANDISTDNQLDTTGQKRLLVLSSQGNVGTSLQQINTNSTDTVAGNFYGVSFFSSCSSVDYQGLTLSDSGPHTGNAQAMGLFSSGNVTGNYEGINMNETGIITGSYRGIDVNTATSIGGDYNGVTINNNADVAGNYTGLQIGNNSTTGTNLTLINANNSAATFSGNATGFQLNLNGTAVNVTAIDINLSGITAGTNQKVGLAINDGAINVGSNYDTSVNIASPGEFQQNLIGGLLHIVSGFPMTNSFGFGNNMGGTLLAEDDMGPDLTTLHLGYISNGLVGQVAVVAGKTVDSFSSSAAGAGVPSQSTGGTITQASMYRALGFLPEGGSLVVNDLYAFRVDPLISTSGVAVNAWGFYNADSGAVNYTASESRFDKELNLLRISTPSNPAVGRDKLYFKNDDVLYGLNSSGTEVVIGPFAGSIPLPDGQIFVGNVSNVATPVTMTGDISIDDTGLTTYVGVQPIATGGTGQTTANAALNALLPSQGGNAGDFLTTDGTNASWAPVASGGTVTSVDFADASNTPIYAISGNPVTTAGTLTITLDNQAANTVFAGPALGAPDQPTFRALVAADIPSLPYLSSTLPNGQVFIGNGSNVATAQSISGDATITNTGVLTISNGAVTNIKMANMPNNTVKANKSGIAAAPSDLALSDVTETGSSILTITNGSKAAVAAANLTIQVTKADSTHDGYLSSTDWNTFNNKQSFIVEKFTLTPTDITNGFVTLGATPTVPANTILTVIGGPMQEYGPDYVVIGANLDWNTLFLDGVLVSGDRLVVEYS